LPLLPSSHNTKKLHPFCLRQTWLAIHHHLLQQILSNNQKNSLHLQKKILLNKKKNSLQLILWFVSKPYVVGFLVFLSLVQEIEIRIIQVGDQKTTTTIGCLQHSKGKKM
jgi:hypothetical protein